MLPAPKLDDRNFQDLVDDAKRLIQRHCPNWTDHNVSDPGVTLIEAVAQMVDQLIYRLNRVPDLNYIRFLELIGVELRPPAAARGKTTFWLSAPQPQPVLVRAESQVATPRTDVSDPVVFTTTRELAIIPCKLLHAATQPNRSQPVTHRRDRQSGGWIDGRDQSVGGVNKPADQRGFLAFSKTPVVGDALLIGLSNAVPSCAVLLRLNCRVSGRGVNPDHPPIDWEAWTDEGWKPCSVDSDQTGGLNKRGDVILHVPDNHQTSIIAREHAGWLRCKLREADPGMPTYGESPTVIDIEAYTIGGTAPTINAEVVHSEILGRSAGTPAQRFPLQRRPVVASEEPLTLTVLVGDKEETWTEVEHFALSGPHDRHFRVDAYEGEIHFGPALRMAGGGLQHYGEIPPLGAVLRLESYRTGGGQAGNVSKGQVRVLKTSIPYVSRVENRSPASGGADAETLEDAKARGPVLLRSRGRAVTADDFEALAREAAPDAARIHCVEEAGASGVRVLVVPHVASDDIGRIPQVADLYPPYQIVDRISNRLDECRLVGTRVLVQRPDYLGLTAVVDLHSGPGSKPDEVRDDVLRALYQLYSPLTWPFGRSVQSHELHAALARIPGVDMSRQVTVRLYPADPDTGRRSEQVHQMDLPATGLVYSYEHEVLVIE